MLHWLSIWAQLLCAASLGYSSTATLLLANYRTSPHMLLLAEYMTQLLYAAFLAGARYVPTTMAWSRS